MSPITQPPTPARVIVVILGLLAAASLMVGCALMVALARMGLLDPNLNPSEVLVWAWRSRADPALRQGFGEGLMAAFAAMGLITVLLVRKTTPLHGAARWAREGEISAAGLRKSTGIILGRRGRRLLVFGGEEHVLLAAPTRSGKGVGVVIPNLLT